MSSQKSHCMFVKNAVHTCQLHHHNHALISHCSGKNQKRYKNTSEQNRLTPLVKNNIANLAKQRQAARMPLAEQRNTTANEQQQQWRYAEHRMQQVAQRSSRQIEAHITVKAAAEALRAPKLGSRLQ